MLFLIFNPTFCYSLVTKIATLLTITSVRKTFYRWVNHIYLVSSILELRKVEMSLQYDDLT